MSRIGLGRHSGLDDDAGDPLDDLVNLFDVGMILAVAFLIAGLEVRAPASRAGTERTIPNPVGGPQASGRGTPVGQVYRLPDGRLVYVKRRAGRPPPRSVAR
jgi:hypothetical protein